MCKSPTTRLQGSVRRHIPDVTAGERCSLIHLPTTLFLMMEVKITKAKGPIVAEAAPNRPRISNSMDRTEW
jgi:hypothetical protein